MGFWSSLVEGAKAAGGWALDHAGDIANVAGTVAKVVGSAALGGVAVASLDSSSDTDKFEENIQLADRKLEQIAQTQLGSLETQSTTSDSQQNIKADSVSGIWKDPKDLKTIKQDLSKWLVVLNYPSEHATSLASEMGEALFTPSTSTSETKHDLVQTRTFKQVDAGKKWSVSAAHAFYVLPMGEGSSAEEECWHGSICARVSPA